MASRELIHLLIFAFILAFFCLTCSKEDALVPPDVFDPLRPTIESFTAERSGKAIEGGIVYSGEDIDLAVQATSMAFPVSCGLSEDEVVEGNLLCTFKANPPGDVPAPGLISQAEPPSNQASWRVPDLDAYDPGEGVVYTLQVAVYDECLDRQNSGKLTLRAFANEGAPVVSGTKVESSIKSASPVTEQLDQNGYYEVERGDECRITVTAQSRTSEQICTNRGVPEGDELDYEWSSSFIVIDLTHGQNPNHATTADFDIPLTISIGDAFQVECRIGDECTGSSVVSTFKFRVVGSPKILSLTGTVDAVDLSYDPYFDNYEVLPGNEIVLTAVGLLMDDELCDAKGIHPYLQWTWEETKGSSPKLGPQFDPLPSENDRSVIEFVVPAASNGTEYAFRCEATDRCNGLSDSETASFVVIVPPEVSIAFVQRGTTPIEPEPESGRYEVQPGDTVTVRIAAQAKSDTSFCEARGISHAPPLRYCWQNPWHFLVLNYDSYPVEEYSDLVFIVPGYTPLMDADLICVVQDMCNELATQITVPLRVVSPE